MKRWFFFIMVVIAGLATAAVYLFRTPEDAGDLPFVSYIADPAKQEIAFYWQDGNQQYFKSIKNLKDWLEKNNRNLVFAMNAGMYKTGNVPQGLYIENKKLLSALDTSSGAGNFYMKPNGVFYITTDNKAGISATEGFHHIRNIRFATQSGPLLLINGETHPSFKKGSLNKNIRNGVGILPGNKILFAMSENEINFYDFAAYFKSKGCKDALYLDGLVSRTYLPEKRWMQTDGDFAVIIAVTTLAGKTD